MSLNHIQISKNFNLSEFQCKCGCGTVKVDRHLLEGLQGVRDRVGKAVRINSGYRCPKHDKAVGGTGSGQHTLGKAADIVVSGYTSKEIAKIGEELGFNGIGTYATFTHLDTRPTKARWNG